MLTFNDSVSPTTTETVKRQIWLVALAAEYDGGDTFVVGSRA